MSTSSSSFDKISIAGFFIVSLFAMLLSSESSNVGSNSKLDSIAKSSVMETNAPKATVPPKLEMVNTENPKKSTMEV